MGRLKISYFKMDLHRTVLIFLFLLLFVFSVIGDRSYSSSIQSSPSSTMGRLDSMAPLDPMNPHSSVIQEVEPIKLIESPANGLGEIKIVSLDIYGEPDYFFSYDIENISYTHGPPEFIQTVESANLSRAWGSGEFQSNVTVLIKESVEWQFTNGTTQYIVGFRPYMQPATLVKMELNDTLLDSSEYFTDLNGSSGFYYDFESFFTSSPEGGIFTLTYYYTVPIMITQWKVNWDSNEEHYLTEVQQNVTQHYYYSVTLGSGMYIYDAQARFNITFPDPDLIYNLNLNKFDNRTLESWEYQLHQNELSLGVYLNTTHSLEADFYCDFTIKMENVVNGLWSQDRLVDYVNKREREYTIAVTDGPQTLLVGYLLINETTIYYDDLPYPKSGAIISALGRPVTVKNMNLSIATTNEAPLVLDENGEETENETVEYVDGITILGGAPNPYYLATGEVDKIAVKYVASWTLTIVIADRIKVPLPNYKVKIYYGNVPYGSLMSLDKVIPYPTKTTDRNGEVALNWVPVGNYTIKVYNSNDEYVGSFDVTPLETINFVTTDVEHFPYIIIVLSFVSLAFLISGIIIFKKNS